MNPNKKQQNQPNMIDCLKVIETIESADATNQILEINEIILKAKEINERSETKSWTGSVKYLLWNATGLKKNLDRIVKRMIDEEILLGFIVETWLNPEKAIPDVCRDTSAICALHPVNYERAKNGVSVIINPNMKKHPALKDMEIIARDTLNGTYLSLQLGTVKILCVYHSPTCKEEIDTWLEEIILKCNLSTLDNFILLGDFNARCISWNDHDGNTKGSCLRNWIEANNLNRLDTGSDPTFVTTRGHSIIDHVFYSNNIEIDGSVQRPFASVAGHRPITGKFTVSASINPVFPTYSRIKLENLKVPDVRDRLTARLSTSIGFFRKRIDSIINTNEIINTAQNSRQKLIDDLDENLTECILRPAKEILGVKSCGKKNTKFEPLRSIELEILEAALIVETNVERSEWLLEKATKEIERLRKEKFDVFAEEVSSKSAVDIMKITSSMLTNRKKQKIALSSSNEALETAREHFRKMNTNSLPSHPKTVEPIKLQNIDLPAFDLLKENISASSIGLILKWIAWNKSAGSTGLSYDLLKVAPVQVMESISRFFQLIIKWNCVPSSWKIATVVPVPKKGDLCDIANYRPISLTETLRKLMEHCLLKYINRTIDCLFLTQGGFRTNHSCNDMIVTIHETLKQNKNPLHIAFLDIRAAYDSVDRRILWRRCRNRGISAEIVELLKQMFDHNSGQVVIGGRRSRSFHIESGVLQGSVLSPCLYSLFIDDLAKTLSSFPKVEVGSTSINCTFYADDIALIAETAEGLQELLNACANHARMNRYRFNVAKCEVISDEHNSFFIDEQELPHTNQFKYLGVELTRKGIDYQAYIQRRCDETTLAASRLSGMGMNIGGFSPSANALIYKVFIRPKLEASIGILPPLKGIHQKLDRTQSQILRKIIRAGKTCSGIILGSILQMPSMEFRTKWLRTRFVRRFDHMLEPGHIVKLASSKSSSWVETKLKPNIFEISLTKHAAWEAEMAKVHNLASNVTGGSLNFETSKRLPWFFRVKAPQYVLRPVLNWLLKRYPGQSPPTCSKCKVDPAKQEHIASCNRLLHDMVTDVPNRYRPETILSSTPVEQRNLPFLHSIAKSIAIAVNESLPYLDFEILSY
jgi:hypothetical protein